jgi:hypothetical protein
MVGRMEERESVGEPAWVSLKVNEVESSPVGIEMELTADPEQFV